jgi:hypothetical protein
MPVLRISLLMVLMVASVVQAQERTAGGSLQAEASWGALKSMIERTDGNVATLKIDVNAMKACGALGKIWTGTQCVNADLVDSIVNCGDQGKVYDKSANACVATAPSRWLFLRIADRGYSGDYVSSGSGSNRVTRHKQYGLPCTNSQMNLDICAASQVGQYCYTHRDITKTCSEGDGNSGACNAQYDGYMEVFKCM